MSMEIDEGFDENALKDAFLVELKIDSQRQVLKILAETLTKREQINVHFSNVPCADIKNRELFMPVLITKEGIADWLLKKGTTLHEIFHLLYTGKLDDKKSQDLKIPQNEFKDFKKVVNVLEDARIEYLGMNDFLGTTELITFANCWFHEKWKREEIPLLTALCFKLKGIETETSGDKKSLEQLYKIAKDVIYKDWDGCLKVSAEVYNLLKKNKKIQQPQQGSGDSKEQEENESNELDDYEPQTSEKRFEESGRRSKKKLDKTSNTEKKVKQKVKEMEKMFKKKEPEQKTNKEQGKKSSKEQAGIKNEAGQEQEVEVFLDEGLLKQKFGKEVGQQDKIDKQLRDTAEKLAQIYGKEASDAKTLGSSFSISKTEGRVCFNLNRANGISSLITSELKDKLTIGTEVQSRQLNGKLNLPQAIRSITEYKRTKQFNGHIYDREEVETPEHSVMVLLDLSVSMASADTHVFSGTKIRYKYKHEYAKEGTYILAKALEELNVDICVRAYNSGRTVCSDILIKNWEEPLNARRVCSQHPEGSTPTDIAIELARIKLLRRENPLKILFSVTDGNPDNIDRTKKQVDECKVGGIVVYGIYMGHAGSIEKEYLKEVYGEDNFIVVPEPEDFKDELIKLYERVIKEQSYGW